MPVQNFGGNTFVAFANTPGFKEMMKKKSDKCFKPFLQFCRILNEKKYGNGVNGIFALTVVLFCCKWQ